MTMNKYRFFTLSLVVSLSCCFLFSMSTFELFSDADYVKSLNLPSNADTLMIPVAGGVAISLTVALAFVIIHLLFLRMLRKQKGQPIIDLDLRVGKKYALWRNVTLLFFYMIVLYCIKSYVGIAEHKFYLVHTLFYISALLTILIFTIWLVNLLLSPKREVVPN